MEEDFEGAGGQVLIIGFGRFGQIVSQVVLAQHSTPPSSISVRSGCARRRASASASISATARGATF